MPQTAQCLLDRATLGLKVNAADVAVGSTNGVAVGSTFSVKFDYNDESGLGVWFGFLFVRDDGIERFVGCVGIGGTRVGGATLNVTITPTDPIFVPGHTARVSVVGMLGGPSPAEGVCALRTSAGELDHAAVQGQRQLLIFMVQ